MIREERETSRAQAGVGVRTSRIWPSKRTDVPRAIAGPTDDFQANSTFPWESGASRRSSATALGIACAMGCTGRDLIIQGVKLILASQSPRRAGLLRAAGYAFDVHAVDVDERTLPGEPAASYVQRLAAEKS